MSITPRKVDQMVRWQIVEAFTDALELISKARGYNTSPLVTRDKRKVRTADEKYIVAVDSGSDSKIDDRNVEMDVSVTGYIKVGADEDPILLRDMLLQDVRTAIMADRRTLVNQVGTGCAISLGRSEMDEGLFLDDGWAIFDQSFIVRYPQGDTW